MLAYYHFIITHGLIEWTLKRIKFFGQSMDSPLPDPPPQAGKGESFIYVVFLRPVLA